MKLIKLEYNDVTDGFKDYGSFIMLHRFKKKFLRYPEKIITRRTSYKIYFNYPLKKAVTIDVETSEPTTMQFLIKTIIKQYKKMYRAEDNAYFKLHGKYPPMMKKPKYNRIETFGPYGIYGHIFKDLALERLQYEKGIFYPLILG